MDKIQDSKIFIFLGFKFQTTFLRFIFQTCRDSGFKFETDGIQDSDLGLQGPTDVVGTANYSGSGLITFRCRM